MLVIYNIPRHIQVSANINKDTLHSHTLCQLDAIELHLPVSTLMMFHKIS